MARWTGPIRGPRPVRHAEAADPGTVWPAVQADSRPEYVIVLADWRDAAAARERENEREAGG
jgi:hypothetical protein